MKSNEIKINPEVDKVPLVKVEIQEHGWGIGAKDLSELDRILGEITGTPEPEIVAKIREDSTCRRHTFEPYDKISIVIYNLKEQGYLMNFAVGYQPHFEEEVAKKLGVEMGLSCCNVTVNSAVDGVQDLNFIAERLISTGILRNSVDGSGLLALLAKSRLAVEDEFSRDEEIVFCEKTGTDLEVVMWIEDNNSKFGFQVRGAKNGYIKLPVIDDELKSKMRNYARTIADAFDTNINLEEKK